MWFQNKVYQDDDGTRVSNKVKIQLFSLLKRTSLKLYFYFIFLTSKQINSYIERFDNHIN